jgi:PKD repeat protein
MSDKTSDKCSGKGARTAVLLAMAFALSGLAHTVFAASSVPADPLTWPLAPAPVPDPVPRRLPPGTSWCKYPAKAGSAAWLAKKSTATRTARVVTVAEIEPNDEVFEAQFLSISAAIGSELDVTVDGSISPGSDVDFYRFFANEGDIIGLVVTTNRAPDDVNPDVGLDPLAAICDLTGDPYLENDNDFGYSQILPPESPFPRVETPLNPMYRWDSSLTFVIPATGDYLIRVRSFAASRRGDYQLKVVARRPSFESQAVGATQIIFLDFDGVENFNAAATFGEGLFQTSLSPLDRFLPRWGLSYEDENAVEDAILERFQYHFDQLRSSSLNGDRDSDDIDGHFDYEIRNSRDNPDPWGQPNVSRVIIGGTVSELGILTLGISEWIDPGNFSREDSAVVLLDLISDADTTYIDSVNSIQLAGGVTKAEAVGWTIGTIAAHEAGHFLGLWHTDNTDDILCLIDQGGDGVWQEAGTGPDGILGTADDQLLELVPDAYDPNELVATGTEFTNVRTAFALSTGKNLNIEPPPPPPVDMPKVSISAIPNIGQAPLAVSFAGGGVDPNGGTFVVFNWNFGDQTTGTGAFVSHTYNQPGTYFVTLSGTTSNAETAQASAEVTVLSQPNQLPQAEIVATPTKGTAPLLVLFEASATDPDGTVIGYGWDFGDGQSGTGQTTDHVFLTPGTYVVTLSVTDNLGGVRQVTAVITVQTASGTAGATVPASSNDSGLSIPALNTCGAGTPSALMGTLAIMLSMMVIRRRW